MTHTSDLIAGVARERITEFTSQETARFAHARPISRAAQAEMAQTWFDRVPLHWMKDWPLPFLPHVAYAQKAQLFDVDGFGIDDFCLGDTGSMFGHSPKAVAKAIMAQAKNGLTYMLPNQAAKEAGFWLTERFGDFRWQLTLSATDANRFAMRVARGVTGRSKVLVFTGCYHGTVDDAMVRQVGAKTRARLGLVGQVADLSKAAICVEFNDLAAVEVALATGEVAAILTEPALTNCAMVLPAPGFLEGLRVLATKYGALLILDETHTISTGLGGYKGRYGLEPDMFVVGKCVAGGVATGVWGLSPELAVRLQAYNNQKPAGHSGMGTTLSANPLQFAALTANLSQVMTAKSYTKMEVGAARLEQGLARVVSYHKLPWHVVRLGARVEFICAPGPLHNGTQAIEAHHPNLEAALHIGLLNRGSLIAPFHNMMLVSPVTSIKQIDRLIAAFDDVVSTLMK